MSRRLEFGVLCAVPQRSPVMLPNYFLEQGLIIALLKTWPTVTYLTGLPKPPPAGKGHGSLERGAVSRAGIAHWKTRVHPRASGWVLEKPVRRFTLDTAILSPCISIAVVSRSEFHLNAAF